jgi:mono/diheme cytochrome c family protein
VDSITKEIRVLTVSRSFNRVAARTLATAFVLTSGYVVSMSLNPWIAVAQSTERNASASSLSGTVGSFSEQAKRGKDQFMKTCSTCHGEDLSGRGSAPPLSGDRFRQDFDGKPIGDLFDIERFTMPQTNPNSLPQEVYLDIVAFLLDTNHATAGEQELKKTPDGLAQKIKVAKLDSNTITTGKAANGGNSLGAVANSSSNVDDQTKRAVMSSFSEQAKRGKDQFMKTCSTCHGEDLSGHGSAPPLSGDRFRQDFDGKKIGDLYDIDRFTMPQTSPGSLPQEVYLDIVAFLLDMNHATAGEQELKKTPDVLGQKIAVK